MNSPARPDYSDARACIVHKSLEICEQCRLRELQATPFQKKERLKRLTRILAPRFACLVV
jgi:hypothetical protein